jgi:glycosyltransferase involved in cell wall biosynthesis
VGADSIREADAVIYNNFFFRATECYSALYAWKRSNSDIVFIHRLDGLQRVIRNDERSRIYDEAARDWMRIAADGAVFQNHFSRESQYPQGVPVALPHKVIGNAPDDTLFYPAAASLPPGPPWNLVYTSWSPNLRKGFPSLRALDQTLDFSKYRFTFVGSLPEDYSFANIQTIEPQPSARLADILRQQHIFIGLSHNEPCSNAVMEALHCGLPALLRNSGGNPEFVAHGGVALFDGDAEIPRKLDDICANYLSLRKELSPINITSIARSYIEFAETLQLSKKKKIHPWRYYFFRKKFSSAIPFNSKNVLKEIFGLAR